MATYAQRAQALLEALVNRPVTVAEVIQNGRALALRDNIVEQYDGMTAPQKAEYFVKQMRRLLTPYRRELATRELVQQATAQAVAEADAEFAETP
jgi:flagellar biosynthesis regulator FlbT